MNPTHEDRPTPEAIAALIRERWPEHPFLAVTQVTRDRLSPGVVKREERIDLSREQERAQAR